MSSSEKIATLIEIIESWDEYIEKLKKENKDLKFSRDFYKSRCELLGKVQKYMKDPERQIVCDILANDNLLPDPEGKRYGKDLRPLVIPSFFPNLEDVMQKKTLDQLAQEHPTDAS